jgi:hypothetical protein
MCFDSREMKLIIAIVCLLGTAGVAAARDVLLPRPRPPEAAAVTAAVPAEPSACQLRLRPEFAQFEPLAPITGPGACGGSDVVRLDAVVLPNRTRVALTPPAILRCEMAEIVVHWVRDAVAPATIKLGAPLSAIDNFASYECRGRNRIDGAKLSEHGRANALDIRSLRLADGRAIGLTDVNVAKDWREGLRASTCARFSTVLGPGSDGYHETHVHIDLAERASGYGMCQWDVREPGDVMTASAIDAIPVPRPRPAMLGPEEGVRRPLRRGL